MSSIKTILISASLFMYGCKSVSYFDSPNTILKKEAVVNMLDGTQKSGLLTVTLEANYSVNYISVFHSGKEEKVLIDSVKSYLYNNEVYEPKQIVIDFDGPLQLMFVKKLTPDSSRIQLYEFFQNRIQGQSRENLQLYYISLPSFDRFETWGLGNKNLVPNFNLKMSKLVRDCPALADKIYEQKKGYYFTSLTISNITKKEVLQRIIAEYNLCASSK